MNKITTLLILLGFGFTSKAQLIATVQLKKPVEGICNQNEVYSLYNGFEGQIRPICSLSKEEMKIILNDKIQFLKENPKFKSKGMAGVFINCEGVVVEWHISNKTKSEILDKQILEVFKTFDEWTVGTLYDKPVDASELFSYSIKNGVLTID